MVDDFRILELLRPIMEICDGDEWVFRGVNTVRNNNLDDINSSLYRWAKEKEIIKPKPKTKELNLLGDIEKNIIKEAKKYFPNSAIDIEILTELRHYEGNVNLIDFSRSLYVALFFACDGEPDQDGELILLKVSALEQESLEMIEPTQIHNSQQRVGFQGSVFIRPRYGYIDRKYCECFKIYHAQKNNILNFLDRFHNINESTVYNDLIGFIQNHKIHEQAMIYYYEGTAQYRAKNYDKAIENLDKAVRLKPTNVHFYDVRGAVHYYNEDYEKSLEDFTKLIQMEPSRASSYVWRGVVYKGKEDYEKSLENFTKAIQLESGDARFYALRGVVYKGKEDYEKSLEDFTKAIELSFDDANYYLDRGAVLALLNEYDKAISDCTKAIELESGDARFYALRGAVYKDKGDYKKSLEDFTQAIELSSDNDASYYRDRGSVLALLNEYDKAINDFTKAIELSFDGSANYYRDRGGVLTLLNEYDKAINDFTKAIELGSDNDAMPYMFRGFVFINIGKYREAVEDFDKAKELDPKNEEIITAHKMFMELISKSGYSDENEK